MLGEGHSITKRVAQKNGTLSETTCRSQCECLALKVSREVSSFVVVSIHILPVLHDVLKYGHHRLHPPRKRKFSALTLVRKFTHSHPLIPSLPIIASLSLLR